MIENEEQIRVEGDSFNSHSREKLAPCVPTDTNRCCSCVKLNRRVVVISAAPRLLLLGKENLGKCQNAYAQNKPRLTAREA